MNKTIVVLLFFLSGFCGFSQVAKPDSLKKALDNYPNQDTTKVITMYRYARSLLETSPLKAAQTLSQAIELAKKLAWQRGLVDLYILLANLQAREEKYDASIVNLLTALKIIEANNYTKGLYFIHFELSESYRLMKDYELAGVHAQKCFDYAKAQNKPDEMLGAMVLLGGIYKEKGQWSMAAPLLDKGMQLAVQLDDEYMQQQIVSHRADYSISIKDYGSALSLYQQNLAYQLKTRNKNGTAWVYSVVARLYKDLNNKDSAYHYANAAFEMAKKYSLAKELKDAYEALYECYYRFGDYKKALQNRLLFDSIENANNSLIAGRNTERARMALDQEKKDALANAEKIKEEAETARVRNLQYTAIAVFALALAFLFWNNRQKQKAKVKIENAYAELKSTQQQLIQSEKMASLGELTAGIAHEIQNPLNFVNNFSETNGELIEEAQAELKAGNAEETMSILDNIKANEQKIAHHGKRADAIVKGMLQHSRPSTGQKEPTDLNALVDEYLRLTYHGFRSKDQFFNTAVQTDFNGGIGKINIVPQDIGRVLLNLYNNAFYAVQEKKEQLNDAFEPEVSVSTKKEDGQVVITVRDNGTGIPEKAVDKVFQPFFTTKPTGEGTGLGLSLSYDIVTKGHGGELKVKSKEGEGSEFMVVLPIV